MKKVCILIFLAVSISLGVCSNARGQGYGYDLFPLPDSLGPGKYGYDYVGYYGYSGLGFYGLGYSGYSGLGYSGYTGVGYSGFTGLGYTAYRSILRHLEGLRVKSFATALEQYDDNVFLTQKNRTTDYITRVIPTLIVGDKSQRLNWGMAYTLDYRHYLNHAVSDDFSHDLRFSGKADIVPNFFHIGVSDAYTRISLSLPKNYTRISLFINQTNQNVLSVSPYFTLKPDATTDVKTGYVYRNVWYQSSLGVNTSDHCFFADAKHRLSPRLKLGAGAIYRMDQNGIQDYTEADLYAGFKYNYLEHCFLFFNGGKAFMHFDESGGRNEWLWDGGLYHQFTSFYVSAEALSKDIEAPTSIEENINDYVASIGKNYELDSLMMSVSLMKYNDILTSSVLYRVYALTFWEFHQFTRRLVGSGSISAQKVEDMTAGGAYTNWLVSGLMLDYRFSPRTSLNLEYRYSYSHSPQVPTDCFLDDQIIAGITMTLL